MMVKEKRVRQGEVEVFFQLKKDESPFWTEMGKAAPMYQLLVCVKERNREVAWYKRLLEREMSAAHFDAFVRKFLSRPAYRESFAWVGSWNGTIVLPSNEIHPECQKEIQRLNEHDHLGFKDFARLKTFGLDKYSTATLKGLESMLPVDQQQIVKEQFQNKRLVLMAFRWMVRGLKPEWAIRKVKTDLQIEQNKRKNENFLI